MMLNLHANDYIWYCKSSSCDLMPVNGEEVNHQDEIQMVKETGERYWVTKKQ